MRDRLIIGAMSGTSADGVDAALVRVGGQGLSMTAALLQHRHRPYPPELREVLFELRAGGKTDLLLLARLAREITIAYAQVVRDILLEGNLKPADIAAIAAHGQTLFHEPPMTIQWFDPSLLAWETGLAVVSDFRRADCAAGGEGAPLVPFADYILFRDASKDRVLLNIGGIANLTWLAAGGAIDEVIAFDTGPGNCISDWICRTHGPFGLSWDVDGQGAARGQVIDSIVERVLSDPYFHSPPPKSTDTSNMIEAFQGAVDGEHPIDDLLATACFITARTIASAIAPLAGNRPAELIASGGGIRNKAIMSWIEALIPAESTIRLADEFAIASDAKEAVAFALLGAATLDGFPSNVPSVTGAMRGVVLGSVTPRP